MRWIGEFLGIALIQILAAQNEYLRAELRMQRKENGPLRGLNDADKLYLWERARRVSDLGRKYFDEICENWKPDTVLGWYQKILRKSHTYDGGKSRRGRPRVAEEIERKTLQIARENRGWGYTSIMSGLEDMGHKVCRSTVSRILKRNGVPPSPERRKESSWWQFLKTHQNVLFQGDFFCVDVIERFRVRTYHVLFFIHLATREVTLAGLTDHPNEIWLRRTMRRVCDDTAISGDKTVIIDRDSKFSLAGFDKPLSEAGVRVVRTARRSPNMNAFAERWVLSVRRECLNHLMLFRRRQLERVLREYVEFYNTERHHQGLDRRLVRESRSRRRQRLGGLLKYYGSDAA